MAWSYSGNPGANVKDAVRFELQDTNSGSPLLQDTEIEYLIAKEAPGVPPTEGEVLSAAARGMEVLARLFSAQADTELGSLKVTYTKQAEGYVKRAKEIRLRAQGMHAPWAGGQSQSEKAAQQAEPDRVQPAFQRDQFTSPFRGPNAGPGPVGPGEQANER